MEPIYWIEDCETVCGECAGEDAEAVLASHGAESDTPAHCARCETFLDNPLTCEGVAYVARALEAYETGRGRAEILVQWAEAYADQLREHPSVDILLDAASGAEDIEDDPERSALVRAAARGEDRAGWGRVRTQMRIVASPDIAGWLRSKGVAGGATHGEDIEAMLEHAGRAPEG